MSALLPPATPLRQELAGLFARARARRFRTRRQWALDELKPATGPHAGLSLRIERQPLVGLWLDAVDQGPWKKRCTTGPTQSGKTVLSFVIPVMYHVFEIGEAAGIGIPDMDMADDKWRRDIKPVIERSRYRDLLPLKGEGSQGGKVKNAIVLRNGAEIKFFSGGGSDKSRAGYNVRVLVITETDGLGDEAEESDEGSKLQQIIGRTRSYDDQAEIYMECTVSIETAPTWSTYKQGTESRIVCPCVHCWQFVSPEREHLIGWQGCEDVMEAKLAAAFHCPLCGEEISDEQRRWMNLHARLVHRGQELVPGPTREEDWTPHVLPPVPHVVGSPAPTDWMTFRWSAFNNLFAKTASIAGDEWTASRKANEDEADKVQRQQVWCLPYEPPIDTHVKLKVHELIQRQLPIKQGIVPDWTQALTVGIDLGKRLGHRACFAWQQGFTGHLVDYDKFHIAGDTLKLDRAIYLALCGQRDLLEYGYEVQGRKDGPRRIPDQVFIDSKYGLLGVFWFLRDKKTLSCINRFGRPRYMAMQGYGHGQFAGEKYHHPKRRSKLVPEIGDNWHVERVPELRGTKVNVGSDYWKTQFHQALACDRAQPGAITFFAVDRAMQHEELCKQYCAEEGQTVYEQGFGEYTQWSRINRKNHQFDCGYSAKCAAHRLGIRGLVEEQPTAVAEDPDRPPLTTPDGRAFFVGAR